MVHEARHDVDAAAAAGLGIAERGLKDGGKLGLASRQPGQAALTLAGIPGRRIKERKGEIVGLQTRGDFRRRGGIKVGRLDGFEAGLGGGLEAVEEGKLGKQKVKIGGETGHWCTSSLVSHYKVKPPSGMIEEPVM